MRYTIRNIDLTYLVDFTPSGFKFDHCRHKAMKFKFDDAQQVISAIEPIMKDVFIRTVS